MLIVIGFSEKRKIYDQVKNASIYNCKFALSSSVESAARASYTFKVIQLDMINW